ncbi:MAG TPA: thermonuclease family protein [Gammaproteobacteria bacterium]
MARIYDGDTLQLNDGRKVRLAGINTPEVAKEGQEGEPLADRAQALVARLVEASGQRVGLRYEQERHDHYGRLLAHLYLADGSSIEEHLLAEGLAQQLVVPPNDWQSACYRRIEGQARHQHLGIWDVDYYQPLDTLSESSGDMGFRLVAGTVQRVAESRKSVWLNLDSGVALRIARGDLSRFDSMDLRQLTGQRVVARGWLRHDGHQFLMTLRDPSALVLEREWQ